MNEHASTVEQDMSATNASPDDVLDFWSNAGPEKWWAKDDGFDAHINEKFETVHALAKTGQLDAWLKTPDDTLALVIVLDQFSRNLFRNDPRAFAQDEQCVAVVRDAMKTGIDRKMRTDIGTFIYLPLMHSENISDQEQCLRQMERLGLENETKYAKIHLDIIEEFGRFPHRNSVLGRTSTPEEQAFLNNGGFSG
jgi:uncharacterized protein (DUF924 family)